MGGRGASSNIAISSEQNKIINNIKKVAERDGFLNLKFSNNKDGSVSYSYEQKRVVTKEKGGKISSPEKADTYERVTKESGVILRDGLRKKNKRIYNDTLTKKGRLPRRR